jgi:hypothetical protein
MEYFGTERIGDKSLLTVNERAGHCYELAGYALALGKAPDDALLIHGSIHGVLRDVPRIHHAWLVLPTHEVWEPMQGRRWDIGAWKLVARPLLSEMYTQRSLRRHISEHGTWGPWPA